MWWVSFHLLIAIAYIICQCQCSNSLLNSRGIIHSGKYLIVDCENVGRSTDIIQLLPRVWKALQSVISDLEHGTASHHGVRTFLKTNENAEMARKIFQDIADGQDLHFGPPVIGCLRSENLTPEQEIIFKQSCVDHPNLTISAATFPTSGLIALCPEFWKLETFPVHEDCPAVSGRRGHRKFDDLGLGLTSTKFAVLLHELTHLYNPLEDFEDPEVYTAEGCLQLDAQKSISNAGNLAIYAASKTTFHS